MVVLPSFAQQTLNWQACGSSFFDAGSEEQRNVTLLGARAQCALMRVPQDYVNQSSAELRIEVLRVAAEQPSLRHGAIVLNPGGPGVDGLYLAPELSLKLISTNAGPGSAMLREVTRRYDLVAFSPRGTGRHSPLNCEQKEAQVVDDDFIADPRLENLRRIQHNARVLAEGCAATPMSQYIHTEATARDMDLLRGLLGEEKLNYIGYSYGGWLGTWYAGLFPDRVGRMLLDSSTDITGSLEDLSLAQADAEQSLVDDVLLKYAVSDNPRYGLGANATALRNRLLALPARLKHALIEVWDLSGSYAVDDDIFALVSALNLHQLLGNTPYPSLEVLKARINTSPLFARSTVREIALTMATSLYNPPVREPVSKEDFVYWSVRCNDSGTSRSVGTDSYWTTLAKDFAALAPFAQERYSYNPCVFWTGAQRVKPAITEVQKAGPLLMLHSVHDVATPMDGARRTWDALPNAHLIEVQDEHQHMVFPYGTACVDEQVARYFLMGVVLPRDTANTCAGRGLVIDDEEDDEDA